MIIIIGVYILGVVIALLSQKGEKKDWGFTLGLPITIAIITAIIAVIMSVGPGGLTPTGSETVEIQKISETEGVSGYLTTSVDGKANVVYTYVTADGKTCEVNAANVIICSSETEQAYVEVTTYERDGLIELFFFNLYKKEVVTFYI